MQTKELIEALRAHMDISTNHEAGLIPVATMNMLSQAADALEATLWRDIDTAPKDGTVICVWHKATTNRHAAFDINIKKAQWLVDAEEWRVDGVGGNVPPILTHWKPLTPPEAE